jgi:hypothetical protein
LVKMKWTAGPDGFVRWAVIEGDELIGRLHLTRQDAEKHARRMRRAFGQLAYRVVGPIHVPLSAPPLDGDTAVAVENDAREDTRLQVAGLDEDADALTPGYPSACVSEAPKATNPQRWQ